MGTIESKVHEDFRKIVTGKNAHYCKLYRDRKFQEVAEMYTENCKFMPAGFPTQIGIDDIGPFLKRLVELGFHRLTFVTEELVGPFADMALERCTFFFQDVNGKELQRGKYVVIWKRVNGDWMYDLDLWNTDHLTMIKP